MTSRERMIRTLRFQSPDRFPRDLWALPAAQMKYGEDIQKMTREFPMDIGRPPYTPSRMPCEQGNAGLDLDYTDAWGCVWRAKEVGVIGEVLKAPLEDWSSLATYQPPFEILGKGMERVNQACAESDLFMLGCGVPRPFERMQFLRGTERLFMDLAYGVAEVYQLRDMVHEFYCREMELWAATDVDGVMFMDDWGTQQSLLIAPNMWQELFKPLYRDYVAIAHSKGKFVFMHSDGMIEAIYPDLVEIGVDAVNSQLFCMDIERLGRDFGGKITFWGEIDRQGLLPFGTAEEVRAGVERVVKALGDFNGGLIAQCEWGADVSSTNVRSVFQTFLDLKH